MNSDALQQRCAQLAERVQMLVIDYACAEPSARSGLKKELERARQDLEECLAACELVLAQPTCH